MASRLFELDANNVKTEIVPVMEPVIGVGVLSLDSSHVLLTATRWVIRGLRSHKMFLCELG